MIGPMTPPVFKPDWRFCKAWRKGLDNDDGDDDDDDDNNRSEREVFSVVVCVFQE